MMDLLLSKALSRADSLRKLSSNGNLLGSLNLEGLASFNSERRGAMYLGCEYRSKSAYVVAIDKVCTEPNHIPITSPTKRLTLQVSLLGTVSIIH